MLIAVGGNTSVGRVLMPAGLGCRKCEIGLLSCAVFTLVPCKVPISSEWMRKVQL